MKVGDTNGGRLRNQAAFPFGKYKISPEYGLNSYTVKKLTEVAFQSAAKELGCDVAAIKAVCEVEAPKGGFLPDGRVTILFERHKFHQYTRGVYSKDNPDISNPRAGGYGAAGAHQWDRFDKAAELDSEAAMEATSWGKFQIMGSNFGSAGYQSVGDFVDAMKVSEDEQLKAFVQIVKSFGLVDELRNHNWAGFARGYNGANYQINEYDKKLKAAYLKHKDDEPEPGTVDTPDEAVTPSDPQATVDQAKQPPVKEINAETATTVNPSKPNIWGQIKDISIPAGVGTALATIGKIFMAIPPWVWGIIIVAIILSVVYLVDQRNKRAQAKTMKAADIAANPDLNNVYFGDHVK